MIKIDLQFGDCRLASPPKTGLRKYGVPPGGPFDQECYELAIALSNPNARCQVFELAGVTATVVALEDAFLCAVGGGHELHLESGLISPNCSFVLPKGRQIVIRAAATNFRCYLASQSAIGCPKASKLAESSSSLEPATIRFIPITECDSFSARATPSLDRVGIRFQTPLQGLENQNRSSRPTTFGAMQLAPSGELLVHGPDGPTIGGYDLLGVVIQADLGHLAQVRPGSQILFSPVTLNEANSLFEVHESRLATKLHQIRLATQGH